MKLLAGIKSLPGTKLLPGPASGRPAAGLDAEPSLRGPVLAGTGAIVAFVGVFFGWSLFATLDSAVVARGVVVVDSHRKTVQHLEGGILRALSVREGQRVQAGDQLAILDSTQADAQLGQLRSQSVATQARIARLRAEQAGQRALAFPDALAAAAADDALVGDALATQTQLFETRWRAYDGAVAIAEKRIEQFRAQINANQARLDSLGRRLALVRQERDGAAYLVKKGYERRVRLIDLERDIEDLKEQESGLLGAVAEAEKALAGTELEIANLAHARQSAIAEELEAARAFEVDLADRLRAALDVRARKVIIAPQDGIVTDLRLVTPGGVVGPGQALMDIVPVDDELIIEARVRPVDAEAVHTGQSAQVHLAGFNAGNQPPLRGTLRHVSADMLTDPRTTESYFLARVVLGENEAAKTTALFPGLPAEVLIVTGERRAISYFTRPITDRLRRAFREE
jgi:HlyD family secretion protein